MQSGRRWQQFACWFLPHNTYGKLIAAFLVCLLTTASWAVTNSFTIQINITSQPFTPRHTYFLSPTGSDAANGLTTSTAWASPNHPVVCGDVIIAAPGTYGGAVFGGTMPTPTGCPSTTGGIDGAGGIWFAIVLCAGSDIGSTNGCVIQGAANTAGFYSVELEEGQSNWAFEGFYFDTQCVNTSVPGKCSRSFGARVCGGTNAHHIALINSITVNSMQGFSGNDCGNAGGVATDFWDYIAAVGVIVQNSNQNGDYQGAICVGAIDFTNLGNHDTTAGTHAFMYNNYGINNQTPACQSQFDGEAFYSDSPEAHLFTQTGVISNNIGYKSTRHCINLTLSAQSTLAPTYKIYNNTCYHNNVGDLVSTNNMDIQVNTGTDKLTGQGTVSLTNNVSYNDETTPDNGGTAQLYAAGAWFKVTDITYGGTGSENVFKSVQSSCNFGNCDAGFNVEWNDQALPSGANFYVNPSFTNTSDLLTNRTGIPNCTGFTNTTACMGWNSITQTLTTPSVISDLTAGCAQCNGKGFQRPSVACVSSGPFHDDFPVWLKGVVYLRASGFVNGATVTQNRDLATIPCGL